jgi:hypothetical protein
MILTVIAPRLPASKALRRQHSSYRMQPSAHTSVLAPYSLPWPCTRQDTRLSEACRMQPDSCLKLWRIWQWQHAWLDACMVASMHSMEQAVKHSRDPAAQRAFRISGDM